MATMVKEKRREKKKSKEKHGTKTEMPITTNVSLQEELPPCTVPKVDVTTLGDDHISSAETVTNEQIVNIHLPHSENVIAIEDKLDTVPTSPNMCVSEEYSETTCSKEIVAPQMSLETPLASQSILEATEVTDESSIGNKYNDLNARLERITIPTTATPLTKEQEMSLEAEGAYLKEVAKEVIDTETKLEADKEITTECAAALEDMAPSAPMLEFEEPEIGMQYHEEHRVRVDVPKLISMPLEEAIRLAGGEQMAEVRAMSEREEAAVAAGPLSGPEHPLVDLLTTFKRSLIAVEREGAQLSNKIKEEEKCRAALWKIEKRDFHHSEACPSCGTSVSFKGRYEVAQLQQEKLPAARMRLEGVLRDLQDSYCHHQHAALLAYCQIQEFIAETMQSNKGEIREALALVLQELKMSDSAPAALSGALERWAAALAGALLDARDPRQLLFLTHQLFRQTRSVRWAARLPLQLMVHDGIGAARALAFLDLLLTRPGVESAVECIEDKEEEWEEVDKDGGGGGVSDGTLRERDMLALLRALPLRDLIARLMQLTTSDIRQLRQWEWEASLDSRSMLRACCACRALLHVASRAARAHAHYARLRAALQRLALAAVAVLCAEHDQARSTYSKDMEPKIQAELEAVFASGLDLLEPAAWPQLPATLLSHHAARDYCVAHIVNLHESSPTRVESLSLSLGAQACALRVRVVARAAGDRAHDYELARIVLEFLFTIGIRRNTSACGGACRSAARAALPGLLRAHPPLYAAALLLVADTNPVEKLDPSAISCLAAGGWRGGADEVRAVAADWARRCPQLLPPLLLALDYTPHTGLSLESQLAIGSWLCENCVPPSSEVEEWCWSVLFKLRVHRTCWGLPAEAPPPHPEPESLFAKAYALMASSWGHCVPLICSAGVEALAALARWRAGAALHCLAPLMLLLAPAHDSIALTPKFSELFAVVLNTGPSLMQRALGRGGRAGPELLMQLVTEQLADEQCGGVPWAALVRAWTAALWRPALAPACALLDAALPPRCSLLLRDCAAAWARAQDEETLQQLSLATRMPQAPLLCWSALLAWHMQRELLPGLHPRLLHALHDQRRAAQRIHVDNALKLIGCSAGAEELVVYRCAAACLAAPLRHPASLQLWQLLLHLYLQRPPADMQPTTPPVGPLFFSGLIKSRTLAQLKRRLEEFKKHHNIEANKLTEAAQQSAKPSTNKIVKSESRSSNSNLFSSLSIADLTGESSDSSEADSDLSEGEGEGEKVEKEESPPALVQDHANLLAYHIGAQSMLCAYAQWLDEEGLASALPHHADIARFIPEASQAAAWQQFSSSRRPPSPPEEREPFPLPPARPPPPRPPPPTPMQRAVATLLAIRNPVRRRSRRLDIKSPVEGVNSQDLASVLAFLDKHLKDIEKLAVEWCAEASRLATLQTALWRLVGELRAPRPLPALRQTCRNRCSTTLQYLPPYQEWCKSLSAETGIIENRRLAYAVMRRLARPRYHAARTAAALLTLARGIQREDAAEKALSRAWRAAASVPALCAPAAAALTAFFQLLAERWVSHEGQTCAWLLSRWCGRSLSALQQALVLALVAPARVAAPLLPALHAALLASALPPHVAFSGLSKFDMARWSLAAESPARLEALAALRAAAVRWGASVDDHDHQMIVELLGVQSTAVCTAAELVAHTRACAELMVRGACPPQHAAHLAQIAGKVAHEVPFDQLGHLLRELGAAWWEARTAPGAPGVRARYAAYAPHVAALLRALHRAFVSAAVQLSYAPERVAAYAWSSLVEAWSAWVSPHAAAPLLPSLADREAYAPMLERFHAAFRQVMEDCPGTEEYLLNQMFEWTIQTYLGVQSTSGNQESHIQMSALLAELSSAPWTSHQWLQENTIQSLLRVCQHGDKDMWSWAGACAGAQRAAAWAGREVSAPRLATALYLFTCSPIPFAVQTLEEATNLPWQRLPEVALEEALDRFFMEHQGIATPYHKLPQFRVILAASELYCTSNGYTISARSREKRARLISQWLRAASAPALLAHVPAYQRAALRVIAHAAPYLESSEGEVDELLSRAMVILCIEPAASAALPVWVSWVRAAARGTRGGCVRGAAALTAFEYFAPLADAAVAAYITGGEGVSWSDMRALWSGSPWRSCAALCARARLHAAHAALSAHAHDHAQLKAALLALLAADIHFVENEVIVALWICVACRVARTRGFEGEEGECRAAAAALLARWAEHTRRSLLKIVTLHADTDRPTPKHRILCSFALCVLSPGEEGLARGFEAAWGSAPGAGAAGSAPGPGAWARAPHPRRLPRLALRLFPDAEVYFKEELEMAPEDPA